MSIRGCASWTKGNTTRSFWRRRDCGGSAGRIAFAELIDPTSCVRRSGRARWRLRRATTAAQRMSIAQRWIMRRRARRSRRSGRCSRRSKAAARFRLERTRSVDGRQIHLRAMCRLAGRNASECEETWSRSGERRASAGPRGNSGERMLSSGCARHLSDHRRAARRSIWSAQAPAIPGSSRSRAARFWSAPTSILYDHLASDRLLDLAPAHAERIYVGKKRAVHEVTQEEISADADRARAPGPDGRAAEGRRSVHLRPRRGRNGSAGRGGHSFRNCAGRDDAAGRRRLTPVSR